MLPRVVLDADVLVPVSLCDFLLRLARFGAFDPVWTDRILDEVRDTLVVDLAIPVNRAEYRLGQMRKAFPGAAVAPEEIDLLEERMANDPKDRHVLAAAVGGAAKVIITFNTRDFPAEACAPFGVTAIHPEDFLIVALASRKATVRMALVQQAADLVNPTMTVVGILGSLERFVPRFVETFRRMPST